jgi:ABC-type transport system substrate-binding protein
MKRLVALVLAVIALTVVPAWAGRADNTLVFGQSVPVTTLGPELGAFQKYPAGYEVSFALYDRLVTFDGDLKLRPQLAERWQVAGDGKSVTFHLRRNVTFHDGSPFNAAAVKFNIERMLDPKRNTTNQPIWSPIAGADVVDTHTVRITTKEPYALLLNTLAHGSGAMVSPAAIAKNGDDSMALRPVGAGPYMLESFTPGQEVVLKAFVGYWGGKPKLDKIVFKYIPEPATRIAALKTGSVDVIDAVPPHMVPSVKQVGALEVVTKPGLRPMGLAILTTREPFTDVRVRRALNHVIPVSTIAEKVFFGFARASDSPLAFNTAGHKTVGSYAHDPKRAEALLKEAGFSRGADGVLVKSGKPFTMKLFTSDGLLPGDLRTAEIAARSFEALGIKVAITKIEAASYWDYLRAPQADLQWDLAVFGFNPSNGAGSYHIDAMFHSNPSDAEKPAAWNIVRYRNAEVDRLIGDAKVAVDPEKYGALLGRAQEIVWNDAPYVWLQVNDVISARRKELNNVHVWPIVFTIVRDAHW